jgi:hypothetical protein
MLRCNAWEIPGTRGTQKYVAFTRDKDTAADGRFHTAS